MRDLQKLFVEEVEKEAPDRAVVLELLYKIQEEDPLESIPVGAVRAWRHMQTSKQKRKRRLCQKIGQIAASVVITFALLGVVPSAFGVENVFQRIGQWTSDLFSFGGSEKLTQATDFKANNPGLQELHQILTDLGVEENVVPRWLPEDYEMEDLVVEDSPQGNRVTALFSDNINNVRLSYYVHNDATDVLYPKDEDSTEVREYNGVKTYIIENESVTTVLWFSGNNVECGLFASNKMEVHQILNSIYEEE